MSRSQSNPKKQNKTTFAKKIFKWKYLIFALAILFSFGSQLVSIGNEVGMRVVVTSLGIDKAGEEYRVSAQIFTPQLDESKTPIKSVVSVTAPTIAEAISQLNFKTGRLAIITHCRLIVLGDGVAKEDNIFKPLNYFMTNNEINWGTIIVATSGEAGEMLAGLNNLEQKASYSWQKFLNSNRENDVITIMSLREFLIRARDKSQTVLITVIDVGEQEQTAKKESKDKGKEGGEEQGKEGGQKEEGGKTQEGGGEQKSGEQGEEGGKKQDSGGQSEGGGQGGGGGQSGGTPQKSELELGQHTLVFQDGVFAGDASQDDVRGFSWFDPKVSKATFVIKEVDDPIYKDALVSVRMRKRRVWFRYTEKDGKPLVKVKIRAVFENIETLSTDHRHNMTEAEVKRSGDKLQEAIVKEIKKQIDGAYRKSVELDSDFLQLNESFFRYRTSLYDKHGKDLFKNVTFEYDIVPNINR